MRTVCPHDCPSVCALDVEIVHEGAARDGRGAPRVGRVRGAKDHPYTRGVICAKVSRYAERQHHPDRLTRALVRRGGARHAKGAPGGDSRDAFEPVALDDALDLVADGLWRVAGRDGAQAIWPFHFAGTMGLVQRDGLERLRRALGTSAQHSTYCTTLPDAGWLAGFGEKHGTDARTMAASDVIVVWGGNPVNTQVNVMHYVAEARRTRGAKLVVIDPYRTRTAQKADRHLMLRPGTDGALACGIMHALFAEGLVDRAYLARHTEGAERLEAHLRGRTPDWAAGITGVPAEDIVSFARLYGGTRRSFLRLGYGFARSRNGAVNMHAATCLPSLTGAFGADGGGALYGHSGMYPIDRTLIEGSDIDAPGRRTLDQSRIGRILCGERSALAGGGPVNALLVQNTNPAVVAPDTNRVLRGLRRADLFTVVHEQFPTETALLADVILPATTFLEHDDLYTASGHTHLQLGPKAMQAPGDCTSNHEVLRGLAGRLGLDHPGFRMGEAELVDATLRASGLPDRASLVAAGGGVDVGATRPFGTGPRRFRFAPRWEEVGPDARGMPALPDHWETIDAPTAAHPLRLVAAPARQFLNTSFSETASARRMEGGEPVVLVHPDDLAGHGVGDGELAALFNELGVVCLRAKASEGLLPGTVVAEGLWPNAAFAGGVGINALVSDAPGRPRGGAVYHDTAVGLRSAGRGEARTRPTARSGHR